MGVVTPPTPSPRSPHRWLSALALVLGAIAVVSPSNEEKLGRPSIFRSEGYVGSAACRTCHLGNHKSWYDSYHRTMAQVATPDNVLATFEGETPVFEGTKWKLEHTADEILVTPLAGPTGRPLGPRRRVVMTTGSHHYQIYWTEDQGEGMEQLPFVWHPTEKSWVPRKAMFLIPPEPGWGDETGRWSKTCIRCHATNGTAHATPEGATQVAEFGISCETCHGPGEGHVAFHEDEERSTSFEPGSADPTITNPARLPHDRSSEVCGQCHGINPVPYYEAEAWRREGFSYRPGDVLSETRHLLRGTVAANGETMRAYLSRNPGTLPGYFWDDGEVRVSGRETNGLVDSPCFQRGEMSCLSCHEMHQSDERSREMWADDQLEIGMEGPEACLQCHDDYRDEEVLTAHTHHTATSSGSDCMNCHMPHTTYGLTKLIRSHTITSPDARGSFETQKPLACNLCHLDRSLGWAADHLSEWYEHERPELPQDEEDTAAVVLWALRGNAGLRAVAAWVLGWDPARDVSGTGWMPYLYSTLLMDPYDAVRWIALQSQRRDPRFANLRLDFNTHIEEQRNIVREKVLSRWLREGLQATAEQRTAVLVTRDGKLDQTLFRSIYDQRDRTPVALCE